MDPAGAVGAARCSGHLPDQPREPRPSHRRGHQRVAPVLVVAGATHAQQAAAFLKGVPVVDKLVDHRTDPF